MPSGLLEALYAAGFALVKKEQSTVVLGGRYGREAVIVVSGDGVAAVAPAESRWMNGFPPSLKELEYSELARRERALVDYSRTSNVIRSIKALRASIARVERGRDAAFPDGRCAACRAGDHFGSMTKSRAKTLEGCCLPLITPRVDRAGYRSMLSGLRVAIATGKTVVVPAAAGWVGGVRRLRACSWMRGWRPMRRSCSPERAGGIRSSGERRSIG